MLLTYSSLISAADSGASRLQQLVDWCKPNFEGLIVFDGMPRSFSTASLFSMQPVEIVCEDCHKAKNLVHESGGKPTKVGEKVLQLQRMLPLARVVYCSATGETLISFTKRALTLKAPRYGLHACLRRQTICVPPNGPPAEHAGPVD